MRRYLLPALLVFALLLGMLAPNLASAEPKLGVGDQAPPLYVSSWLNGKAVEKFEKDKVYVIECWATWCGPCIRAIPHVTKIQQEFKDKVVVIGLNVWEQDQSKVEPFVKKMGDKMGYVVAIDDGAGNDGKSAAAWLKAAGQNGIPCSFVVDQQGKIAWIGHPMAGMDKVIAKVVAGTYDAKKEAEAEKKAKAIEGQLRAAYEGEKWDEMLALLDNLAALRPEAKGQLGFTRVAITLMHKKDFPAGYALAEKLGAGDLKDDAQGLNQIAWFILDAEGLEKRDFAVALKLATRAAEVSKHEEPAILDTLARAHFESKQIDKAIEMQTKAVALSAKVEDPETRDELAQTLEKYKKAKGGKSEDKKD